MAEVRGGIRVRTTAAAVLVVALALLVGGAALVLLLRASLVSGVEESAQNRAEQIADQVEHSGLPRTLGGEGDDESDEPEGVVAQVTDGATVVVSSQPSYPLPDEWIGGEADAAELPGGEHGYVVVSEGAEWRGGEYVVTVAASREDVDETTGALVPLLALGIPILLVVVGATTWLVVGRSLAPVERIRAEVDAITDERLDRRVPDPGSRDEIGRLAGTMNAMLARLQAARARQQRFVSDASHELRSPVATLRQSAEVARAHPDAFPPGELADTVFGESVRMQRLVEQLLVLARADEGRRGEVAEVDLDDLLYVEASRLRRSGLDIDTTGVTPVRTVGDLTVFSQITRNLTDNAARHATGRIWLTLHAEAGWVDLRVRDDGAGVPPGERDRIFDRFVRLDEARARDDGGSGLGLAIVRELARGLGGEVVVTDRAGGAEFAVRLPMDPA